MTYPANEPVLRDVQIQVWHYAEDSDTEVRNGKVDQKKVDVVAHFSVAQDDEYNEQITCDHQHETPATEYNYLSFILQLFPSKKMSPYVYYMLTCFMLLRGLIIIVIIIINNLFYCAHAHYNFPRLKQK